MRRNIFICMSKLVMTSTAIAPNVLRASAGGLWKKSLSASGKTFESKFTIFEAQNKREAHRYSAAKNL
jgi:hypothetical protein